MDSKKVSKDFSILHTHLRNILVIHNDERKLKYCFTNTYTCEYDSDIIASYAYNLPSVTFKEQNELLKEYVISKSPLFSSHENIEPIFFYAHIGQGKTTYLKHLINIRVKEDPVFEGIRNKVKFIYLPLTDDDDECTHVRNDFFDKLTIVFEELLEELHLKEDTDTLKEVFGPQYSHFKRIAKNDADLFQDFILSKLSFEGYVRNWIKWISVKYHIKVCCIFDNIDQHFHLVTNHRFFHKTFQYIRAFFVQLIVPLRISNKGFLEKNYFESFHPIPVTLSLPNFGDLIIRRISYIKNHFKNELGDPIVKFSNENSVTTDELFKRFERIVGYINKYEQVKNALEILSNYNARSFLKITANIFSSHSLFFHPLSGNEINYNEQVKDEKFHSLFLYSLMLRNNEHYYEEGDKTPIVNLFDNKEINNWNSFIKLHILLFLDEFDNLLIHYHDFIKTFREKYRIEIPAIKKALNTLLTKKCCSYMVKNQMEVDDFDELVESEDFYISISPRGKYHLTIINEIEYYEILAIPRLFKSNRDARKLKLDQTYMSERASNLKEYLDFLLEEEKHVKTIIPDENKIDEYLYWSKNVYPRLIEDYNRIFLHNRTD